MASKKKDKTLDELLEEALVPEGEQPYELPEGWVWTFLGQLGEIGSSTRIMKSEWKEVGVPFYRAREIVALKNNRELKDPIFISESKYKLLKEKYGIPKVNDLLITGVGTIGETLIVTDERPFYFKDGNVIWFKNINELSVEYLDLFMKTTFFKEYIKSIAAGTTVDTYTIVNAKKTYFPLAPLKEQHRIVIQLKSLLSKIDKAQQLIEEAKETFELRRTAVLDLAFRGGKSREFNGLPSGWEYKEFDEVATVKSNLVSPADYLDYPHIAPDNIEKHTGRLLEYQTIREDNVKSAKHYFEAGAILYSKIRPYLSKVTIADFEGLCSADMYPIETELNIKYLYWYILSPLFLEQATTAGSRSVLPKINQKELGKIRVPVCNDTAQEKTVQFIESVLKEENETLSMIETAFSELSNLKQSILSKAFKGELGTGNAGDESALELLKAVLKEQLYN